MRILLIIATIVLAIIYAFSKTETNDQYEVLKEIKNVEIRKYKESVNASYYSDSEKERNNYFFL